MLTLWTASSLAAACRRLPTLISAALCAMLLHLVPSLYASVEKLCCFVTHIALPVPHHVSLLAVPGVFCKRFLRGRSDPCQCRTCPECKGPALQCRLADEEGVRSIVCLQEDSDMAWFDLDVAPIQVSLCMGITQNIRSSSLGPACMGRWPASVRAHKAASQRKRTSRACMSDHIRPAGLSCGQHVSALVYMIHVCGFLGDRCRE